MAAVLIAPAAVHAQASGQPGTPTPAPSPSQPPPEPGAIGGLVVPYNASVPQPNPNASENATLPARRNALKFEPVSIYPFLGMGFGYNSNLAGSNVDKVDSTFWVLTPRVVAEVRRGGSRHRLIYNGNFGRYASSSRDNFNEHEFVAETNNQFTARADLYARAYYLDKSDPRGLLARSYSNTPDKWHAGGFDGTFGYGARSAPGRIEGFVGYTDKKYENNRDRTFRYDLNTATVGGRFFYRVSPKTRLLAEVQYRDLDYTSDSSLDNKEVRLLTGATWDAAASTTGTVKIGWMKKRFSDSSRSDFSGMSFEGRVRWEPRTYSAVDLIADRSAVDSWGIGIYSIDTSVGAVWTHNWRSYISTQALLAYTNSDFEGLERVDKMSTAKIGGYYSLNAWLKLGAELTHQRRKSDDAFVEFSRNVVMFTLGGTI
ncbi:MAG: outer membrane beta-barrel protein [Burkholderiaceae bacterium]